MKSLMLLLSYLFDSCIIFLTPAFDPILLVHIKSEWKMKNKNELGPLKCFMP